MNPWLMFVIVWGSLSVGFFGGAWWRSMQISPKPEQKSCPECRRREMRLVKYNEECG